MNIHHEYSCIIHVHHKCKITHLATHYFTFNLSFLSSSPLIIDISTFRYPRISTKSLLLSFIDYYIFHMDTIDTDSWALIAAQALGRATMSWSWTISSTLQLVLPGIDRHEGQTVTEVCATFSALLHALAFHPALTHLTLVLIGPASPQPIADATGTIQATPDGIHLQWQGSDDVLHVPTKAESAWQAKAALRQHHTHLPAHSVSIRVIMEQCMLDECVWLPSCAANPRLDTPSSSSGSSSRSSSSRSSSTPIAVCTDTQWPTVPALPRADCALRLPSGAQTIPSTTLAIAYHPGFWGYDTWKPGMVAMLSAGVPCVCTAYSEEEGIDDADVLETWDADAVWAWEPQPSPAPGSMHRAAGRHIQNNSVWHALGKLPCAEARSHA